MIKLFQATCLMLLGNLAFGQLNTVGSNKPLAFLNPALQNIDLSKGILTASFVANPLAQEERPLANVAIGEYKLTDKVRIGFKTLSAGDRLFGESRTGLYSSFKLPLEEEGSFFFLGLSADFYQHTTKLGEYNKVFMPNRFYYDTDNKVEATTSGLDLGFGMAYESNGLTVGVGLNKINRPEIYLYPNGVVDTGMGPTLTVLDTSIIIGKGNFELQNNINVIYRWSINKEVNITHSLHFSNVKFGEVEYVGFQNIAEIRNKHTLGLGVFYNGSTGFIATAGFGISENLRLEGSAFIVEDLNYDIQEEKYVASGIAPILEACLQFRF